MMKKVPIKFSDILNATIPSSPLPDKDEGLSGLEFLPSDFEELKLFALLLWKFKYPNGPLSFIGRPDGDPDGPFKWDFLFNIDGLYIHIIRSVNGLEVRWWNNFADFKDILTFFYMNFRKYETEIEEVINSLEKYKLILNPYIRHKQIAKLAKDNLEKISPITPTFESRTLQERKLIDKYIKESEKFIEDVNEQAKYSMLLVLESAFMAEAYLNLIYVLLVRDEIRLSKKLFKESLLRKWKSKIERLKVDCNYIDKNPNLGDFRIRDAKKLFDLRNRIAHSYPDLDAMLIGEMWFFKSFPIFKYGLPSHKIQFALNNQIPSKDDALFAFSAANNLIQFLNELISDKIIHEFLEFAKSNPIGYNVSKGIYGIPFANISIMSLAFTKQT